MKHSAFLPFALAALLFAGCQSTPTKVNSGPIAAKTFSFVNRGSGPAPAFADNREEIHTMIQSSISRNLEGKGMSRLATGGDVTVAYLIITGNNASTTAINTYFGYGRDFSGLQDKAHKGYTGNDNPNLFEAGTLLVDIIDGKSFKLLNRAYVTRPLLKNPTAEARTERIQEAVDAVLKDVRIAK
jgi:predicted small secreted protein